MAAPPKVPAWVELRLTVPVAAQDAVTAFLAARGADGIQEEHPGLDDLGDDGPIVTGDPRLWAGDAPENPSGEVTLSAWLPAGDGPEAEAQALRGWLAGLEGDHPGVSAVEIAARTVEEQDWNAPWKALWRPTPVGRNLLICPSWLDPEPGEPRRVLRLDPGMAFGTGTHFTTASCLELLEDLLEAGPGGARVLDVGTGTGILAVASLLLGAGHATGIDLDPAAVAEARANAARNGVADRFEATGAPLDEGARGFDLVLANLVAETLVDLAPLLAGALAPGGTLLTSGVLHARAGRVEAALGAAGLTQARERRDDAWVTAAWTRG